VARLRVSAYLFIHLKCCYFINKTSFDGLFLFDCDGCELSQVPVQSSTKTDLHTVQGFQNKPAAGGVPPAT
jgi:hypothetical protein